MKPDFHKFVIAMAALKGIFAPKQKSPNPTPAVESKRPWLDSLPDEALVGYNASRLPFVNPTGLYDHLTDKNPF